MSKEEQISNLMFEVNYVLGIGEGTDDQKLMRSLTKKLKRLTHDQLLTEFMRITCLYDLYEETLKAQ